MKIRCDVCEKEEASVFCSADEAALCDGCDRQVHHANKLAGKHKRFSLLHPSCKDSPLCDICQERRAFLFCQEDRAILCRECDVPIHKANEHTKNHSRFLLTGVKLSSTTSFYPTSLSSNAGNAAVETHSRRSKTSSKRTRAGLNEMFRPPSFESLQQPSVNFKVEDHQFSDSGSYSTSSISEYLDSVPGWRVDDFLDPAHSPIDFCQVWNTSYM